MLSLVLGRAGTGKTGYVLDEIRRRMGAGETGLLLIVPEQYSHDAERQMCSCCGDAVSMFAETHSFTRLCGRVFAEAGGSSHILDSGGQILVMHRAVESVAPRLKVFGSRGTRAQMLEKMLDVVKEFKTLRLSAETLADTAARTPNPLRDKLLDLSLIYGAYDALVKIHGGDTADAMTQLAEKIGESTVGAPGHIYFDGFNDFTAQEMRVIEELLKKGADVTICLTYDPADDSEVFALPRKTIDQLTNLAAESCGDNSIRVQSMPSFPMLPNDDKSPELGFLEEHLFTHDETCYSSVSHPAQQPPSDLAENTRVKTPTPPVTIYSAPTRYAECVYAARRVLELVWSGYRWRDIGVMARDWNEYGHLCENVFEKFGIPFFSSGRADILDKPPAALIEAALDIAVSGWEYKPVFRYLKTGLAGIPGDACAELENYVLIWNIRGTMWTRDWTLPVSGYGGGDEKAPTQLNALRQRITRPITRLRDGLKGVTGADDKLRALFAFMEEIRLPEQLANKAGDLVKRGETRLADEYTQLWGVIVNAMEQMYAILGQAPLSAADFGKLFILVLSRYDVGVIPVSLDRTALGGMDMSRRRNLKSLIILGATDENMPNLTKGGGALSDNERLELSRFGMNMPMGLEERLNREMNMLYSTVTLPSRELTVTYPNSIGERPSFVIKRIKALLGPECQVDGDDDHMPAHVSAPVSTFMPALTPDRPRLKAETALSLYGSDLSLSATRVDRYYTCPFKHYAQNGLRLNPRARAQFDPATAGIFMHYVLEGVTGEIKLSTGFKNTDETLCRELTGRYIERFARDVLYDFEGKNARFVFLFRRLGEDALRIVLDMLDELKHSDFEPLDFEFDLSKLTPQGDLRGMIDRVDGCKLHDKMYIRVVDYKTGKKTLNLSDVLHGRDMQMFIYLFALEKYGADWYDNDIAPAGVLYAPARDVILNAPRDATDDELRKQREKELRRAGVILDDPDVLEAMENGEKKKYLPVRLLKNGDYKGDGLLANERIGMLSKHVDHMLRKAASEILDGTIDCRPGYIAGKDACDSCDYKPVCAFDENAGDKRNFMPRMKPGDVWKALSGSE